MFVNALTIIVFLLFLIVTIAVLVIVWGNFHYQFRKPLKLLRDQADQITSKDVAKGDTLPEPQNKDLASIVRAFNSLSLKLQHTVAEMELRITERTHLLEEGTRLVQEVLDTTPNMLCLVNLEIDEFNYVNHEFSVFLA